MMTAERNRDSTQMRIPAKAAEPIPDRFIASIVILDGYAEGMEYPLTRMATVIGRDKTADIMIKDSLVSRHHAAIQYEDGRFILKDMGSTNGTLLNGKVVETAVIRSRDKITFGDTTVQFVVEERDEGKVFEIR